jgi:serine/threonine-protein kinase
MSDETVPSPRPGSPRPPTATPASDPWHGAAWAPGALVAGRYRIVGLLGRGGMGEVCRADDLTLGQSVALKFLHVVLAQDPDRQRRFFQEVRVAREISHPNVCRVYDVDEAEGRPFLSMEFVDGEDLSSLLRRIGRLPQEKGVEIARQLCAGLAALHDKGVAHRDLKPANVMLDGRGRVRLTDFGLAALVEEIAGTEVRAGTPAYMAPEQLRGERVDAKSDLFALGLVLYEIFTGKRAYSADTPAEISRLHRESTPRSPSTILPELDPAIERVIDRCLQKDPALRPASALLVAAALPGGDPLAAALAAGEVPSIEMVAAAGAVGGVRPWVGIACLLATIAGIVLGATIIARARLHHWDPMEKSAPVLQDRAREILAELGHGGLGLDSEAGFTADSDVMRWIVETDTTAERWQRLQGARPPALVFWHRQSPRQLIPLEAGGSVSFVDPPPTLAGMARVVLDSRGRLIYLDVVPPERGGWPHDSTAAPAVPVSWDALFAAAGFDLAGLREVTPEWAPALFVDSLAAWRGTYREDSTEVLLQAGAFDGRPTYFSIFGPWSRPQEIGAEARTAGDRIVEAAFVGVVFVVLVAGFLLALRNLRLGRGDRLGARRLAVAVIVLTLFSWVLRANHASAPSDQINMFLGALGPLLLVGGFVWAFYLALEPYARKTWPERLVGWSRLLIGRVRDPLVGRDILIGGVFFLVTTAIESAAWLVADARGMPQGPPDIGLSSSFLGASDAIASVATAAINVIFIAMFVFVMLLLLRLVFRSLWVTGIVWVALYAAVATISNDTTRISSGLAGAGIGLVSWIVLLRFGFLAFIVGMFFAKLVDWFPVTLDSSAWYSGNSMLAIVTMLGLTLYGLWIALAGKSLFGGDSTSV